MRKVMCLFSDYICPVLIIVGHVILAGYLFEIFNYGDGGFHAFLVVLCYWLYGITFVTDVIPFFKRLIKRRT